MTRAPSCIEKFGPSSLVDLGKAPALRRGESLLSKDHGPKQNKAFRVKLSATMDCRSLRYLQLSDPSSQLKRRPYENKTPPFGLGFQIYLAHPLWQPCQPTIHVPWSEPRATRSPTSTERWAVSLSLSETTLDITPLLGGIAAKANPCNRGLQQKGDFTASP
ncbi:hypothetical protein VTI74DRAFT_374 [Chaetomium olivicolor]